jgi:dsDNA-binding SOS-regulon protein
MVLGHKAFAEWFDKMVMCTQILNELLSKPVNISQKKNRHHLNKINVLS